MYAGRIVEATDTRTLFKMPAHPYTQALLQAVPRPDAQRGAKLAAIGGRPPILIDLPPGCAFRATVSQGAATLPPGDASLDGCRAEPEGGLFLSVLILRPEGGAYGHRSSSYPGSPAISKMTS